MNVLELMIRAVKGTVEEGVTQVLGGLGLVQETEQAPPATKPPAPSPQPKASTASEPKVTSFEVVDAVFPGQSTDQDRPFSSASASKTSASAAETPREEPEAGTPKSSGTGAAKESADGSTAKASSSERSAESSGATGGEPSGASTVESDRVVVREVFERRSGPLRGFEIAEETGISPWWRLKDVLKQLVDDGTLELTEDGQYSLRRTETP